MKMPEPSWQPRWRWLLSPCSQAAGRASRPKRDNSSLAPASARRNRLGLRNYDDLRQRIKQLGLPTGDSERFHIHAQVSIYNQGLLVTIPANVGIDERHDIETTIHTHDATGIIHMEAPRPYNYTLDDLFAIWGVRFGAGTLGGLQDDGSNRVWVYVNNKRIADPARYVLRNGDDVSIGYGPEDSFPHKPGTHLLQDVLAGKSTLSCTEGPAKKQKVCLAPKPSNKT